MANIANLLKEEITRIARKETKKQVETLRKMVAAQRRDIAALKRERIDLKRETAALGKKVLRGAAAPAAAEDGESRAPRFSAAGLRSLRTRLRLSAADFGKLIGVTGQSVYSWEQERSRPRAAQVEKIAGLRGIGLREATSRLAESGKPARKRRVKASNGEAD
jgi:DNA-binding XRE family transcriptional regulator